MTTATPSLPERNRPSVNLAAITVVLIGLVLVVFGQVGRHQFINYDDADYVYGNSVVRQGLTWAGVKWAFAGAHADNWHPLTWLSHMLDCQLYGLNPAGHHWTNIILHALTVVGLFWGLREMTGATWRSGFVAAVFAIHPLRVESVAWVAERKDVLSGLFFVLTLWAYTKYARDKRGWRYGLALGCFALGLMSKPMLVSVPVVLLLVDYWPLQRPESWGRLLLEKLPFALLSAASCLVTLSAQTLLKHPTGEAIGLALRLENALRSCAVYIRQLFWPAKLALIYPFSYDGWPHWEIGLAGILIVGLTVIVLRQRRQQPWLPVGWFWYLVMLLPVLGIVQVGRQAHADRYTYLPEIGLVIALTWWAARWPLQPSNFARLAVLILVPLLLAARQQASYWQNSETIWRHTIACTEYNDVAHLNLGAALYQQGAIDGAIREYQTAVQLNPAVAEAQYNLASALLQRGRAEDALPHLQRAVELNPKFADARLTLGNIYMQQGKPADAIAEYKSALQDQPGNAAAQVNLGNAFEAAGQWDQAIAEFSAAVKLQPAFAQAHNNLGDALMHMGRFDEGIAEFQTAVRLQPDYAKAVNNLKRALAFKASHPAAPAPSP